MATYYIEVDTYWQNSPSSFVGPFNTAAAARAWFDTDKWQPSDNVWLSTSQCGGDIRSAYRIYPAPLTKTEARRHGMRDHNVINPTTHPTARALAAVRSLEYAYE